MNWKTATMKSNRPLIVLDLDQTLIDADFSCQAKCRSSKKIRLADGSSILVCFRPHMKEFVNFCFKNFDVAVWTAADRDYAEGVVNVVFGRNKNKLVFFWSREDCTYLNDGSLSKPLKNVWERFGSYDKTNTIIVDDNTDNCVYNVPNSVIVPAWSNEIKGDDVLKQLVTILKTKKFDLVVKSSRNTFFSL
jgi:TFIIF-interacting CTD phosphatase-like protein